MEQFSSKLRTSGFDRQQSGERRGQLQHCPRICVLVFLNTKPQQGMFASLSYIHSSSYPPFLIHPLNPARISSATTSKTFNSFNSFFSISNWLKASDHSHSFQFETPSFPLPQETIAVCEGGFTKTSILLYCTSHT
jgi:hypothetical protein